MTEAYVAAGSNRDPVRALGLARRELTARFGPVRASPVYRSPDHTGAGADYLNAVFELRTDADPASLAAGLRDIERLAGRRRDLPGVCALDLDLLLSGAAEAPPPHPDLYARADLLAAMAALAPTLILPDGRGTMAERLAAHGNDPHCVCLGELEALVPD